MLALLVLFLHVSAAARHSWTLTPFVDELQVAPVLPGTSHPLRDTVAVRIHARATVQQLHSELPRPTRLWGYQGQVPGPTVVVQRGQPLNVTWVNDLPRGAHALPVPRCLDGPSMWAAGADEARMVPHLHGAVNMHPRWDGRPEDAWGPGEERTFYYPNSHPRGATLWVHDHAMGITHLNTLMGLASFWIVHDPLEQLLRLPSGKFDVPLFVSDVDLDSDAQIYVSPVFQQNAYYEHTMVNGRIAPYMRVTRGKYRFRLLNGSGFRVYNFTLSVPTLRMVAIASDGGLLERAVEVPNVQMLSGERVEIVVDFATLDAGVNTVELVSNFVFDKRPPVPVLQFRIVPGTAWTLPLPELLVPLPSLASVPVAQERAFELAELATPRLCGGNSHMVWTINGLLYDQLTEFVTAGTMEVWRFDNPGSMDHPMHLHGQGFAVLSRRALATGAELSLRAWERHGWKDTVYVGGGESVRIQADFRGQYVGRYPYHCHLTSHEDDAMMRQYVVVPRSASSVSVCGDGICSACEDCRSCSADCPALSGAVCGNRVCEAGDGETCDTCPADCPRPGGGCCGAGANCSSCADAPCMAQARLPACCGDLMCEGAETAANCPLDCDATHLTESGFCGDCLCDYGLGESSLQCPADCPVRLKWPINGRSVLLLLLILPVGFTLVVVLGFWRKDD